MGMVAMARSAHADLPSEEHARSAFEDGVALEKRGSFAEALAKFKESEASKPTLGNRYHKAFCLERLGQLAAAVMEYEAVEQLAREGKKTELADATLARLEPLRRTVPLLSIHVLGGSRTTTDVLLDGAAVAPSLLDGQAFRVDSGAHVVIARANGRQVFQRSLQLAAGAITSLDIILVEAGADDGGSGEPSSTHENGQASMQRHERGSRRFALPLVTTAGAVALGATGVAAYVLAGDAQRELRERCATGGSCDEGRTEIRTLDAVALGAFVGSAALATASVLLWKTRWSTPPVNIVARGGWLGLEGALP